MENKLLVTLTVDELKTIVSETVFKSLALLAPPKKEDETLLRRKDVAKLFSVSLVTINQWMKSGRLPYHRINSRIYFKKSEVMKAMEISPKYKRTEDSGTRGCDSL